MLPFVTQDQIKGIKAQLEAEYAAKLSRTTVFSQGLNSQIIKLVCKNNIDRDIRCPFLVQFYQYQKGFLMKSQNVEHFPVCTLNCEEAYFAKNKLVLDAHREDLLQILRETPEAKPKEILETLIERCKMNPKFLTLGLEGDRHFERRMKKKFDNTILELRNQLNIQVPKETKERSKGKIHEVSRKKPKGVEKDENILGNGGRGPSSSSVAKYHQDLMNLRITRQMGFPPVVELINDQPENTLRIHLVNRSKEKGYLGSEGNGMERNGEKRFTMKLRMGGGKN